MNILIVFGREEARRRWLRNHRSLGTVKMPQGEIILENGVVVMLQVATPDNPDKFQGMTFSAVFEDDSFAPFPGWHEIINSRVRKGRESTLASPEVQELRERSQFLADEGCSINSRERPDGRWEYQLYWEQVMKWQDDWFGSPEEAIDHARRVEGEEK